MGSESPNWSCQKSTEVLSGREKAEALVVMGKDGKRAIRHPGNNRLSVAECGSPA